MRCWKELRELEGGGLASDFSSCIEHYVFCDMTKMRLQRASTDMLPNRIYARPNLTPPASNVCTTTSSSIQPDTSALVSDVRGGKRQLAVQV